MCLACGTIVTFDGLGKQRGGNRLQLEKRNETGGNNKSSVLRRMTMKMGMNHSWKNEVKQLGTNKLSVLRRMTMKKRVIEACFGIIVLLICVSILSERSWSAEKYPTRPVELVCGFPAGGQADLINRLWAKFLEKYLNNTVVSVNKPGAGGAVATIFVAGSRPDGYTILNAGDSLGISTLIGEAKYKLEDVRIVAQVQLVDAVIAVSPEMQWKTFQEFMDYAKKNPGVRYAHPGIGTSPWILMEDLNKYAGLKLIGVPFNGDAESIPAVIGKHVPVGIFGAFGAKTQADNEKLRILFSFEPSGEVGLDPKIPSFKSVFGKELNIDMSAFLAVPAKTPDEIVQILEGAIQKMTSDPDFNAELKKFCYKPGFVEGKTFTEKKYPQKMSKIKILLHEAGVIK